MFICNKSSNNVTLPCRAYCNQFPGGKSRRKQDMVEYMENQCGPIPLPYREVKGPEQPASQTMPLLPNVSGTLLPDSAALATSIHQAHMGALQVLRPLATAAVERKLRGQMTFPEFKSMGDMILWVRMLCTCPSCTLV